MRYETRERKRMSIDKCKCGHTRYEHYWMGEMIQCLARQSQNEWHMAACKCQEFEIVVPSTENLTTEAKKR